MPSNRPSQYNRSSINRNNSATIARQDEAYRLRQSGMSYIDIARALGYTPNGVPRPQSAAEAVRAAERRLAVTVLVNGVSPLLAQQAVAAVASTTSYTRTFGTEIEFFGITPSVAAQAINDAGIACNAEGYNHHVRNYWKIVTDASVTSRGTGVGSGLELVSPVLRGQAGFIELAKAVTALLNAGAKVDRTCGIHVHVGADGFTGADIVRVADLYTQNNTHIDTVLASSRHSNSYAVKYSNASLTNLRRTLANATTVSDIQSHVRGLGRYYTVNVTSYAKYGTLEFRQHQGSLNGEKVVSWVKFLLTMMDKAVSMTDGDVQNFGSLEGLLDNIGAEGDVKSYLTNRARTLTASR